MNISQLQTMLWLRWRLTCNQWRRGGGLNAVIMFLVAAAFLFSAMVGGIIGLVSGFASLPDASPFTMLVVWDVLVAIFLLCWAVGLITELQRSELLDLSRLLHLPVSIKDVFLLNYLASLFSPGITLTLPAMLGLMVGLTFGHSVTMILLLPLVLGFFFMVTAWTYCLRGWLAALMVNKRRRRAIIMGMTMMFILLAQLPNLMSNVWLRNERAKVRPDADVQLAPQPVPQVEVSPDTTEWPVLPETQTPIIQQPREVPRPEPEINEPQKNNLVFEAVHRWVPLLWLPRGALALAEGHLWPALWGSLGMWAIGCWGIIRAYRGTLRFYQGAETNRSVRAPVDEPIKNKSTSTKKTNLVERSLPAVPEPAAAMAMASLRSMLRAPEIKMALVTNVLIFLILGMSIFFGKSIDLPDEMQPFMAAGAVSLTLMGLTQVMANLFGFDRSGFRTYVLLPTARHQILLGKNLAIVPFALIIFSIYLLAATVLANLGIFDILAAVFEFVAALLAVSVIGNFVSIFVPYRIAAGSLKPTKTDITTSLLIVLSHILSMMAILPVLLPAGVGLLLHHTLELPTGPATLVCAFVLATVSAGIYWITLRPLGHLLERQEQRILRIVTQEVE